MTSSSSGSLAVVESPAQLLNVRELAYESPDLADVPIAVRAPRTGPSQDQLRALAALAEEAGHPVQWYESRLGRWAPGAYWALLGRLSDVEQLVIGDPFSGLAQSLFATCRPRPLTLVDDGIAIMEFARRWAAAEPLIRSNPDRPAGGPQPLLGTARDLVAGTARRRLLEGGVRIFTALPVELPNVEVVPNAYAWTRSRFPEPKVRETADLVGNTLVEAGVVGPERYLAGVRALVTQHRVGRYVAHPKEGAEKLARVTGLGLEVVRPDLPLELMVRRGPVGARMLSFPDAVLHTLPLVLAETRVEVLVCEVGPDWYRPEAPDETVDILTRLSDTAKAEHGLRTVSG
jgi:hypothetical protein